MGLRSDQWKQIQRRDKILCNKSIRLSIIKPNKYDQNPCQSIYRVHFYHMNIEIKLIWNILGGFVIYVQSISIHNIKISKQDNIEFFMVIDMIYLKKMSLGNKRGNKWTVDGRLAVISLFCPRQIFRRRSSPHPKSAIYINQTSQHIW